MKLMVLPDWATNGIGLTSVVDVSGAVISQAPPQTNQNVNIMAQNGTGPSTPAHLNATKAPSGNQLFVDGHVNCVQFHKMWPRYSTWGSPAW